MIAYLVRHHGTLEDGRVLPPIESVVGFDRAPNGIRPEMIAAIERAILGRNRNLMWERVDIHEVKSLGLLLMAEVQTASRIE